MLYSIMCGNVGGVDPNQRRLVYLVSSTEQAYDEGLACVFSDGNAATYGLTRFEADSALLAEHVDWSVMRLRMWNNTATDPDRRRRRMAEFLVHDHLPIKLIHEVGVFDTRIKRDFAAAVGDVWTVPVHVRREWYF
jgi:ssDNA thymidine ADP-ribosyltransferase, DarT